MVVGVRRRREAMEVGGKRVVDGCGRPGGLAGVLDAMVGKVAIQD